MKLNGAITIETTRRCNLRCRHCCRGKAQNVDMSIQHIEALLKQFHYNIDDICFTGGEPSLYPQTITEFIRLCRKYKLKVSHFNLTTNGTCADDLFISALLDIWMFCGGNGKVVISDSQYHKDQFTENYFDLTAIKRLKALKFTTMSSCIFSQTSQDCMKQGFAERFGSRKIKAESFRHFNINNLNDFGTYRGVTLHLNCEGKIILGSNWSYSNQRQYALCDVQDDIFDALRYKSHLKYADTSG